MEILYVGIECPKLGRVVRAPYAGNNVIQSRGYYDEVECDVELIVECKCADKYHTISLPW